MKMLTVSVLVCAVMALTAAADVPEAEPVEMMGPSAEEENQIAEKSYLCPPGWTEYDRRCFLYVPTRMTWANAEKNCQSLGGNLASVHSFIEHHVIQGLILRITNSYPETWLGGFDATQEGTWFWSDGTSFRFSYWSPGQPDNRGSSHCLVMNSGVQEKFDDHPCRYTWPSVCAMKL